MFTFKNFLLCRSFFSSRLLSVNTKYYENKYYQDLINLILYYDILKTFFIQNFKVVKITDCRDTLYFSIKI